MVNNGADLYGEDTILGKETDLIKTAIKVKDLDLIKILLNNWNKPINISDYFYDICNSTDEIFRYFLNKVVKESIKNYEYVFCKYAKINHYNIITDLNICFDIQSALKYTILYKKLNCFIYLVSKIKHKEQLDYVYTVPGTRRTFSLLTLCSVNGYITAVNKLLSKKVNIDIVTINEKTETVNCIMSIVDNAQYNKLSLSQKNKIIKTLKILLKYINVNWQNTYGQTALMFANRNKNNELANILIEYGADPLISDVF